MKINEVDEIVDVGKKAIRFYEQEGLLTPHRNPQNGYRDYNEKDIQQLFRIKLLRKLGLSIAEIRHLQSGQLTIADGMERHIISLQREQKNLERITEVCNTLSTCNEKLETFDATETLRHIQSLEEGGTTFMDKQLQDQKKKIIAPIIIAVLTTLSMIGTIIFLSWAYYTEPTGAPPLAFMAFFIIIPLFVIVGVIIVTKQRLKEIKKGELYEASKY